MKFIEITALIPKTKMLIPIENITSIAEVTDINRSYVADQFDALEDDLIDAVAIVTFNNVPVPIGAPSFEDIKNQLLQDYLEKNKRVL